MCGASIAVSRLTRGTAEKNVALFGEMGVFSRGCKARETGVLDHYNGTVEIEALTMVDMINQHVIPAVKESGMGPLAELGFPSALQAAVAAIHAAEESTTKAELARVLRLGP